MNTALLIIDMQNDFVLEGAPMQVKGALSVLNNVKKVLDYFRNNDLSIIHIVRSHKADGSDVEITRKEIFKKTPIAVESTKGAEIVELLKPKKDEKIIKKLRMSAFFHTELIKELKSLDVDTIVIVGIQTPNCVRATAFDSIAYDYETYLVDDAVAAQTDEIHKANVLDMANIGIKIIKTSEIRKIR
jgi:nicotinamidase-related amidase